MRSANGDQKWKSKMGDRRSARAFRPGQDDSETGSPRQSTWNQLKKMTGLPGGIAGESGKSGKKTISTEKETGRVSSAKPSNPAWVISPQE